MKASKPHMRAIDDAPFVVFSITLLLLAVTCSVLSYYMMFARVPNPQVQDWNSFLERFNRLDICLERGADYPKTALDAKFRDFALLKPAKNDSEEIVISLFLKFHLRNLEWFCSQNVSLYVLSFEVDPKKMGLLEDDSKPLQVGFILSAYQITNACQSNTTKNLTVSTCVHLKGSSLFLPVKKHPEQCVNDIDPAERFANINSSKILRPQIASRVVNNGVLGELSAGNEQRVCAHGGILTAPTFSSDGNKSSMYLPRDVCKLISYRLLMAAVALLLFIPVIIGCNYISRRFDNSRLLSGGEAHSVPYVSVKTKFCD